MSYTDEEYKQLGGNIDPDIWKTLESIRREFHL